MADPKETSPTTAKPDDKVALTDEKVAQLDGMVDALNEATKAADEVPAEVEEEIDVVLPPPPPTKPERIYLRPTVRVSLPPYMAGDPVLDPRRTADQVREELVNRQINTPASRVLRDALSQSERRRYDAIRNQKARKAEQGAAIFLTNIVFPTIDGYAEVYQVQPVEVLGRWIAEGKTFSYVLERGGEGAVNAMINQPLMATFRPFIHTSLRELTDSNVDTEAAEWWLGVIMSYNPGFGKVIEAAPNGVEWLRVSLGEVFTYLRRTL